MNEKILQKDFIFIKSQKKTIFPIMDRTQII